VYKNISSCVTNCGYSSKDFGITRGVRQGCPLSAYLFIVVAEILAIKIRNNHNIKGISIGNTEIKVVQMADDTTSFLKDIRSLEEILSTLDKFRILAGLKLNLSKSEAMWLGKARESKEKPMGLKWVKGVKALGIFFSYNENEMEEKNFIDKLKELKKLLALWGQRDLSIIGRITVFKSLAFSKIIYQCNNLAVKDDFLKQVNQLAFQFIWGYKQDKVKRTAVIAKYEKGGLKMLDVTCFVEAQKVMWVKRLLKKDEGSWKTYPKYMLSKILGNHSFQCNTDIPKQQKWMPEFYKQLFASWYKCKVSDSDDPFDLRRQVLWYNKNIMVKKKEFFFKIWYEKGIILFHDILDEKGDFRSIEELSRKFNVQIKVMDYNSLKLAIPPSWKISVRKMKIPEQTISSEEHPYLCCENRLLALSIIQNRDIYWELIRRKETIPVCALRWCREYGIEESEWKIVYKFYAEIKDTKLKAFQFKILNNLVPCNLYLWRIKKSDTRNCSACNEMEDMAHYLVRCPVTAQLWVQLSNWWKSITGQEIAISERDVMLGMSIGTDKISEINQLNMIILAVKWKIHVNKQLAQKTCMYQVLIAIRQMIDTLGFIACRNHKSNKHEMIWGNILNHLT
jgi:hypothetical protein